MIIQLEGSFPGPRKCLIKRIEHLASHEVWTSDDSTAPIASCGNKLHTGIESNQDNIDGLTIIFKKLGAKTISIHKPHSRRDELKIVVYSP